MAILGATGAGKSTLVNLIPRFYDVTAGRVLIDGLDIRGLKQDSLLAHIGIVPQETILFSGTVRDNIRYGRPRGQRRGGDRGGQGGPGARVHPRPAAGLRHPRRGARRQLFGRAEAAHRHRPRPDHAAEDPASWTTAPARWTWRPRPGSRTRWRRSCATAPASWSPSASAPCSKADKIVVIDKGQHRGRGHAPRADALQPDLPGDLRVAAWRRARRMRRR